MSNLAQQENKLAIEKATSYVNNKINGLVESNQLQLVENYNVGNAVMGAMQIIQQDTKLANCTPESKAEAVFKMAVLGLDPSLTQCYFVPYGDKVTLMTSYFGKQTALKRINGIISISAREIYNDDEFDYNVEMTRIVDVTHKTSFKNRNSGIVGAYAVITLDPKIFGVETFVEVMDIEEIKAAWGMGHANGKSKAHNNFQQEMAKKSVINRATKNFVNTTPVSEHNNIFTQTYQEVSNYEYKVVENKNRVVIDEDIVVQDVSYDALGSAQEQENVEVETQKVEEPRDLKTEADNYFDNIDETPRNNDIENLLD